MQSAVETAHLGNTPPVYTPEEKIPVIVVENYPALGKLTAARFLEWVSENPDGTVSLPTGKTPEYFIRYVTNYLENWESKETRTELECLGLNPGRKPDLRGLRFVQIDEFYPINSSHHNSFFYYVNKYYLEEFGIQRSNAMLIDCNTIGLPVHTQLEDVWPDDTVDLSLRYRKPASRLERRQQDVLKAVDQWCVEYEDRIRRMGGIGFFLGGIGPDGHIGFNVRGSDIYSTTRLTEVNYETQAAAASDLGGIEVSRKRKVITVGLETITYNKDAVALIIAAGEAKAGVVNRAVTAPRGIDTPASALRCLPKARFYITGGAAKYLITRNQHKFSVSNTLEQKDIEKIVINISLENNKKILDLTSNDYRRNEWGKLLLAKTDKSVKELNSDVDTSLKEKIEGGLHIRKENTFLHTEPHHDDIMLGYLPYVVRHIREHSTAHHFVTFTSGFTAVTNDFMLNKLIKMREAFRLGTFNEYLESGYFDPDNELGRNRDVWQYLDGVASMSESMKEEGMLRRFLRNLIEIFDETDPQNIADRVEELINYFQTQYPGKKDLDHIQKLKGMSREWESACLWGYFGWNSSSIRHLRLGFYKGDIFTEEPTVNRDVIPITKLLETVNPDVVTVAFDPEGSGPDTHYKVLQAVSEALKIYEKESGRSDIRIIGYRNVWYRFHPSEANVFVPVSLNMLTLQHGSFMSTYISQKDASFPSFEHDGPFSTLAQRIQVEQYEMLKTCLGREFFYEHPSALIRGTRGFVFIKDMSLPEFHSFSRDLRKRAENR